MASAKAPLSTDGTSPTTISLALEICHHLARAWGKRPTGLVHTPPSKDASVYKRKGSPRKRLRDYGSPMALTGGFAIEIESSSVRNDSAGTRLSRQPDAATTLDTSWILVMRLAELLTGFKEEVNPDPPSCRTSAISEWDRLNESRSLYAHEVLGRTVWLVDLSVSCNVRSAPGPCEAGYGTL